MQTRLTELGFAPGSADGAFGDQTQQACGRTRSWCSRAPRRSHRHGHATTCGSGCRTRSSIQPRRPGTGEPRRDLPARAGGSGVHRQQADAGHPHLQRRAMTDWCDEVTSSAGRSTPTRPIRSRADRAEASAASRSLPAACSGSQRQVEGHRVGALGGMDNPIYFNYGIAMHGAKSVPLAPGVARMHPNAPDASRRRSRTTCT